MTLVAGNSFRKRKMKKQKFTDELLQERRGKYFSSSNNFQKRPFVHNSVCSQFLEGVFAILAECSQFCLRSFLIEIQEEIHYFAGWEGGGVYGQNGVDLSFSPCFAC